QDGNIEPGELLRRGRQAPPVLVVARMLQPSVEGLARTMREARQIAEGFAAGVPFCIERIAPGRGAWRGGGRSSRCGAIGRRAVASRATARRAVGRRTVARRTARAGLCSQVHLSIGRAGLRGAFLALLTNALQPTVRG